jgi:hypothetical protein
MSGHEIKTDVSAYDPLAPLNQADPYAGRDRTLTPYDPTGRRQTGWGPEEMPEPAPVQMPSVGRIVHYVGSDGRHYAAIITKTYSEFRVNLTVFGDFLPTNVDSCQRDLQSQMIASWHWPEQV